MTTPTLVTAAGNWFSRRQLFVSMSAALATVLTARQARGQDAYGRAVDRALDEFGSVHTSRSRIAASSEPGPALSIKGQLFGLDGSTPLPGALVFAYHTDQGGLYDGPNGAAHSWRLRGAARTDAGGRFEFRTVRPAPYPGGRIPAHVHFVIFAADARFSGGELRFADDPIVDADERAASERAGRFGWVKPVQDGQVAIDLRTDPARRL